MGCAKLGAFWQGRSIADGRRAVEAARADGVNLFDTADCYARGISERVLARALGRDRGDAVVCTKVGLLKTPLALLSARRAGGAGHLGGLARGGDAAGCYAPGYVTAAAERSLRRLRSERVDLLLLHAPPLEDIRRQDYLPALRGLVSSGKVGHYGFSCATVEQADAALDVPGVAVLQVPYSASRRRVLEHVRLRASGLGVGLMAAGPFDDAGLLAPAEDPGARARACLQFALAAPGVASVVAGMSAAEHVHANVAAAAAPADADALGALERSLPGAGTGAVG